MGRLTDARLAAHLERSKFALKQTHADTNIVPVWPFHVE